MALVTLLPSDKPEMSLKVSLPVANMSRTIREMLEGTARAAWVWCLIF
jgi:hypothetical protein